MRGPKNFLKAPLASIYTNFEGRARAGKKCNFLVKAFQKVFKNAFFGPFFFKILTAAPKIRPKRTFGALGELEKSIWSAETF